MSRKENSYRILKYGYLMSWCGICGKNILFVESLVTIRFWRKAENWLKRQRWVSYLTFINNHTAGIAARGTNSVCWTGTSVLTIFVAHLAGSVLVLVFKRRTFRHAVRPVLYVKTCVTAVGILVSKRKKNQLQINRLNQRQEHR